MIETFSPPSPTESESSQDEQWLEEVSFLLEGGTIPDSKGKEPITPKIPEDVFSILAKDPLLRNYFIKTAEHALKTISFELHSKEESIRETSEEFDLDLSAEEIFKRAQTNLDQPAGKKLFLGRVKLFRETITRAIDSVREMDKIQTDPMSQLYRKERLEQELGREVAAYNRQPEQKEMILLFLDGDKFKHYNDTYGHEVGDEIIKQLGGAIKASIRENDFAGRKGGDEFFVVLNNISLAEIKSYQEIVARIQNAIATINLKQAIKTAYSYDLETDPNRRKKVEELLKLAEKENPLSATIGVTASNNREGLTAKKLFTESDNALAAAKKNQRGSVQLAEEIELAS